MKMSEEEISQMLRDPDHPNEEGETLESLKRYADDYLLNGPEGNFFVLRLISIIEKLREGE